MKFTFDLFSFIHSFEIILQWDAHFFNQSFRTKFVDKEDKILQIQSFK